MRLLIASKNSRKIRELRHLLGVIQQLELSSLNDFPGYVQPEENGATFEENALIKVKDASNKFKIAAMADDSGLVVPALQGAPGVNSSRYSGVNATDAENRKKLLRDMKDLHGVDRNAYFECCIAFCSPDANPQLFQGRCMGSIAQQEKGKNGFGYDPLFIKDGYSLTFGEMEEAIKNQISHRAKAIEKFLLFLERFVKSH